MVVLSIQDKSEETSAILGNMDNRLNLNVELIIDLEKRTFAVKDPI